MLNTLHFDYSYNFYYFSIQLHFLYIKLKYLKGFPSKIFLYIKINQNIIYFLKTNLYFQFLQMDIEQINSTNFKELFS